MKTKEGGEEEGEARREWEREREREREGTNCRDITRQRGSL